MGEGFDESGAGNAGIQGFDTHAPRWNTIEMCVQIKPIPSTLRVFSAGTQYFLKKTVLARTLEFSEKTTEIL